MLANINVKTKLYVCCIEDAEGKDDVGNGKSNDDHRQARRMSRGELHKRTKRAGSFNVRGARAQRPDKSPPSLPDFLMSCLGVISAVLVSVPFLC